MYCPNCGAQAAETDTFCRECGLPLGDVRELVKKNETPPAYQQMPEYQPYLSSGAETRSPSSSNGDGNMAIVSLVLGILSVLLSCSCLPPFICGVLAIIFGGIARKKGARRGMALAGILLGVFGILLCLLTIGFFILVRLSE